MNATAPLSMLDMLFSKLGATYGATWDRSLGVTPIAEIKTVWSDHLSGFTLGDIKYALAHLPTKCPNVLEFRDICRAAPKAELKLLPSPAQDIEKVNQVLSHVKDLVSKKPVRDPKQWAWDLKARAERGEKLGAHQITAFRQALGHEGRQSWQ